MLIVCTFYGAYFCEFWWKILLHSEWNILRWLVVAAINLQLA